MKHTNCFGTTHLFYQGSSVLEMMDGSRHTTVEL